MQHKTKELFMFELEYNMFLSIVINSVFSKGLHFFIH